MYTLQHHVLFVNRGNYTTITIHLLGGTLLSWRVNNKEMLYMKMKTAFNNITPIRGGIKYAFPYYGRRINGPKHGFARYVPWSIEKYPRKLENGDIETVLSLKESEYTKSMWNYRFKILFSIVLGRSSLKITVKVENTCNYFPFSFNLLRHSIFRVEDIRICRIKGLSKCKYMRICKNRTLIDPDLTKDDITISREYNDAFIDIPEVIEVENISKSGLKLRVTCTDSNDSLIYNPWDETNKDVPEDSIHNPGEYLYCLGVGNGYLREDILLNPKESWESTQLIEVIDEREEEKINTLARMLSDPWEMLKNQCSGLEINQ